MNGSSVSSPVRNDILTAIALYTADKWTKIAEELVFTVLVLAW